MNLHLNSGVFSRCLSVCAVFLLAVATPAPADDVVINLARARAPVVGADPVTQSYILTNAPAQATAVLVLFPGGAGKLGVFPSNRLNINASNFLVRSRWLFAAEGFHVATFDAASDFLQLPNGLRGLRGSAEHLSDIAAVIDDLRGRFPGLPIWLVTTSRGTGGAYAAALLGPAPAGPDGLVLTSSLTRGAPADGDSLELVPLEQVTVPTLIVNHKDDACPVTPPEDAKVLKQRLKASVPKVAVHTFKGGSTPLAGACDALSPHGFFGIEPSVVGKITDWISKTSST